MDVLEILDALQCSALRDEKVKEELLQTRIEKYPLEAFCSLARSKGYPLYAMDLIDAGEAFHAAMKRSTNGGGENSPMLEGQDDFYELFFAGLDLDQ